MKDFKVLLIAHGSRSSPFYPLLKKFNEMLRSRGYDSTFCIMEFEEPTIESELRKLVENGVTKIVAVPLMIGGGTHVTEDIPLLLQKTLSLAHAQMKDKCEILYSHSLGPDSRIVDVVESRVNEALNGQMLKKITE